MRDAKFLRELALTIGAVLGTVCILVGLAAVVFGITPLVFTSGSMQPSIPTGSVAMSRTVPATDVAVGDVVSVERSDGSRITHRVDSIGEVTGNSVVLSLKGDANAAVDPEPYVVVDAERVFFAVPYVGYFVAWLSTPVAWIVGGALAAWLLWIAFAPDLRRLREPSGRHAVLTSVAGVVIVSTVVGAGFSHSTDTQAAPLDVATAQASITPVSLARPASFTCANPFGGVDLSWPNVARATAYRLVFTPPVGANPTTIDFPSSGTATTTYRLPPGLTSLFIYGDIRVTLQTKFSNFLSAQFLVQTVVALSTVLYICKNAGTVTSAAAPAARSAQAPGATSTDPASSTAATPSTAPTPSGAATPSTAATPSGAATSGTEAVPSSAPPTTAVPKSVPTSVTTESVPPESPAPEALTPEAVTLEAVTSEAPTPEAPTPEALPEPVVPTVSATPAPPPADAFVSPGNPKTSGRYTASIDGGSLTITDADGSSVYEAAASVSERYGSGAVWSSDGNLYVLSAGSVMQIAPVGDGTAVSSRIDRSELPADVAALL
ncbi:signal peptidase I [Rhodococcoides yunnanense]|uniref:signal peptidase I n=1 Tax=Rhodococcoides yunnanense TaxID=278209 RepID=UPI000934A997|nr:signal peptidase I [Rhodococcus yunnanensis]